MLQKKEAPAFCSYKKDKIVPRWAHMSERHSKSQNTHTHTLTITTNRLGNHNRSSSDTRRSATGPSFTHTLTSCFLPFISSKNQKQNITRKKVQSQIVKSFSSRIRCFDFSTQIRSILSEKWNSPAALKPTLRWAYPADAAARRPSPAPSAGLATWWI